MPDTYKTKLPKEDFERVRQMQLEFDAAYDGGEGTVGNLTAIAEKYGYKDMYAAFDAAAAMNTDLKNAAAAPKPGETFYKGPERGPLDLPPGSRASLLQKGHKLPEGEEQYLPQSRFSTTLDIPVGSSGQTFQPNARAMELAEELATISPDLGKADDILAKFARTDKAPQAPLPPAMGGPTSALGALFRGFGGEAAVQNDAQIIMNSMAAINQTMLANLQQQGYKTMRDADTAKARAALAESEAVQQAEAERASVESRISQIIGAQDKTDQLKMEMTLAKYRQQLREGYHAWWNDENGGQRTRMAFAQALSALEKWSYAMGEPEMIRGENGEMSVIVPVAEDQTIQGLGPNNQPMVVGHRQDPNAIRYLEDEAESLIASLAGQFGHHLQDPNGKAEYERMVGQVNRKVEDIKQQRVFSELLWQGRYNAATPGVGDRIYMNLKEDSDAWIAPMDRAIRQTTDRFGLTTPLEASKKALGTGFSAAARSVGSDAGRAGDFVSDERFRKLTGTDVDLNPLTATNVERQIQVLQRMNEVAASMGNKLDSAIPRPAVDLPQTTVEIQRAKDQVVERDE